MNRLMIVDDALIMRMRIREVATLAGWTVVAEAANGVQAVQLFHELQPDLVTLDMVMPEMDGTQLTQQIRQRFPAITARMPIIALTANTNPVERERCLAAGMDDVLHKPMDTDSLVRCVNAQIRRLRGTA